MINREPPIGGRVSVQILKIVEHFLTSISCSNHGMVLIKRRVSTWKTANLYD